MAGLKQRSEASDRPASCEILSMHETAQAVGLSYERFRKVWRDLAALDGFPAPVVGRRWLAEAVRAWRLGQSMRPAAPGRMPRARVAEAGAPSRLDDPGRRARAWRQLEAARARS